MKTEHKLIVSFVLVFFLSIFLLTLGIGYLFLIFFRLPYPDEIQALKDFLLPVVLWELVLIIGVSYVFAKLVWIYLREKEQKKELLQMLVLAISHKVGNFLSIQRINLEMLKNKDKELVSRLIQSCEQTSRDLEKIITLITSFLQQAQAQASETNLKQLIPKILAKLQKQLKPPSQVTLNLASVCLNVPPQILEIILFNLLENSFYYAKTYLQIQQDQNVLKITNDLEPRPSQGHGLGLLIAQKLGEMYDLELKTKAKKNRFQAELIFPQRNKILFKHKINLLTTKNN